MSETAIHDYLTQQIKVNRNIITYRLLSRALSLHVNDAKRALEAFYEANTGAKASQPLHATFLISGEEIESVERCEPMDVDSSPVLDAPSAIAERVPRHKILLVPQESLERSKSLFRSIKGIHVYSVSASSFMNPNVLSTTVEAVRKMDADRSAEDLQKLGVPISSACKFNANTNGKPKGMDQSATKASTSKPPAKAAPSPVTVTTKKPSEDKVKSEPQEANIPPRKASTATKSGGLDWSKAKPVNAAKSAPKKASSFNAAKPVAASQEKGKRKERAASVSSSTTSEPKPKRGVKRATPPSDDDELESRQPPKSKARLSVPSVRAKNGVLLSDEEEDVPKKIVRRKAKSDASLMDWSDDENVVSAARHTPGPPSSRGDGDEDFDDDGTEYTSRDGDAMDTTDGGEEPIYAKVSRPKKKAWPVGRNGLRKKRILKEREYKDERGFLKYEDYSEYESVESASEEPPAPSTQKKSAAKKPKVKEEPKVKVKKEEEPVKLPPKQSSFKEAAPPKPKTSGGAATGGRKGKTLDSFFGKK